MSGITHTRAKQQRFCTIILLLLTCVLTGRLSAGESKPNFLFVLSDDQRWDALSVVQKEQGEKGRFPWLKTPNLDKLAGEGVRFRSAFVVNSLCSPSRASFLTGMYGYHNGIKDNKTPLPENSVTFATAMRSAGYKTGYIGKWHMDGQKGPRPGFDYSASFIGQGRHFDCPFEVDGQLVKTLGWVDDVSVNFAIDFLRKNSSKPFLLAIGLKACHSPFTPPPRYANTYEGEKSRPVPNVNDKPPFYDVLLKKKAAPGFALKDPPQLLACMRFTAAIDENTGKILDELEQLGLKDNTVVVFAGDNGYYLGEHGLGDKRSAYDESLRIPLLLRYPKQITKGKLIDNMVLNIDLAPTLLDLAGVPIPKQMQGQSWRPLLENKKTSWRRSFYYEYLHEPQYPIPHVQAIRTDTTKLIVYPEHPEWAELFDLASDPYETNNLANDPAKADLRRQLESEFRRRGEEARRGKPSTSLKQLVYSHPGKRRMTDR